MSTVLTPTRSTARRGGAGWTGMARVTWYQHRWAILLTAAGIIAAAGYLLWWYANLDTLGPEPRDPLSMLIRQIPALEDITRLPVYNIELLDAAGSTAAGAFAVFWGAPLLAREFDQRTHLLVWTQDVSPVRWLVSKALLLMAVITVLTAGYSVAGTLLTAQAHAENPQSFRPFPTSAVFELWPPLLVGRALFAFALGLTVGVLIRRTLPSMLVTLTGFTAWCLIIVKVRPYYLPPLRADEPMTTFWRSTNDVDGMHLAQRFIDAAGNLRGAPYQCSDFVIRSHEFTSCLRAHNVTPFQIYQPPERLFTFRLIETAIYVAVTAGLLLLAWRRIRKITTV